MGKVYTYELKDCGTTQKWEYYNAQYFGADFTMINKTIMIVKKEVFKNVRYNKCNFNHPMLCVLI